MGKLRMTEKSSMSLAGDFGKIERKIYMIQDEQTCSFGIWTDMQTLVLSRIRVKAGEVKVFKMFLTIK